eukprot:10417641-Lingulodinium_polyedra.AAC.1
MGNWRTANAATPVELPGQHETLPIPHAAPPTEINEETAVSDARERQNLDWDDERREMQTDERARHAA